MAKKKRAKKKSKLKPSKLPVDTKVAATAFTFVTNNDIVYDGRCIGRFVNWKYHEENNHLPPVDCPDGLILNDDCPVHWQHIARALHEQCSKIKDGFWTEDQDWFRQETWEFEPEED